MRQALIFPIALMGGLLMVGGCAASPPRPVRTHALPRPHATARSSGGNQQPHPGSTSPRPVRSASSPPAESWTGQFTGYDGFSWRRAWGYIPQGSYGQSQLTEVTDPSAPGNGSVLRVKYGKGSSANSCHNCPSPGGGQFYTDFTQLGRADLATAKVLYLRYYVKFEKGFDFGRGGKLPGLYGGPVGQESGGHHGQAFSTRYMWRDHPVSGSLRDCAGVVACSEVYIYSPQIGSGYGTNVGGTWNWQADDRWHMIEQEVSRTTGSITVWYDGTRALSAPAALGGISGLPFSGVFFSTFFGGHDTSWGPAKAVYAYFADFTVSTSYIGR